MRESATNAVPSIAEEVSASMQEGERSKGRARETHQSGHRTPVCIPAAGGTADDQWNKRAARHIQRRNTVASRHVTGALDRCQYEGSGAVDREGFTASSCDRRGV